MLLRLGLTGKINGEEYKGLELKSIHKIIQQMIIKAFPIHGDRIDGAINSVGISD